MFIKVTNAHSEHKGEKLIIRKDIIRSVHRAEIRPEKDIEEDNVTTIYETVTVIFCGELGSWYVDESIDEIYEMLK